jgi:hypothetical protein
MNERIRALAIEAGAGEWGDSVIPAMMDIEKFAQLIVAECCTIIAPSQEHRGDASYPFMGGEEGVELLDGAVRMIEEHFEVE